ncbi:hypothetical protein F2Q69_00049261 [Brassica cretica]|uniref:Uncharacterized protein n=1 Tax=Brassica cretica TaxID=69181 RepID=A0A8S9PH77_BRACR|nr:hypothetical protein F2Q69_00049261 [Brassica cretica]
MTQKARVLGLPYGSDRKGYKKQNQAGGGSGLAARTSCAAISCRRWGEVTAGFYSDRASLVVSLVSWT